MDVPHIALGRRLYRMFLLSLLSGVLWTKGYLWTLFVLALALYLVEVILRPVIELEAARRLGPAPEPEPEPAPRPGRRGRPQWRWPPEGAE